MDVLALDYDIGVKEECDNKVFNRSAEFRSEAMSASRQSNRLPPRKSADFGLMFGAIICWILVALLFRFAPTRALTVSIVLCGPCVLLLTYYALGGDIPRKVRQKGYERVEFFPMVFLISIAMAMVVAYCLPYDEP